MRGSPIARTSFVATLIAACLVGTAGRSGAEDVPQGIACADFALGIDSDGESTVDKEFTDANGTVVRTLSAGKGSALTFTNLTTGKQLSLKANGSVAHVAYNPDGSFTQMSNGHFVIILWPTDIPAGPSTTLYTGRVVFTSTATSDYEILQTGGKQVDICKALS